MKKTKLFAAYLPQYHETEDNNRFWGKGYTDWVAVKNAKPLYEGHVQPKKPEDGYYYDLSKIEDIKHQVELANTYGIDGFNIYHYWFKDGKQELETPAELILNHPELDIEFFFTWDNGSWKRTWSNVPGNDWTSSNSENVNLPSDKASDDRGILVEFAYQDEAQWKVHFDYLKQFFLDKRYLKIDNKPVFMFFSREREEIINMQNYWNGLAKEIGFDGVYICSQKQYFKNKTRLSGQFVYEPTYSVWGFKQKIKNVIGRFVKIDMKKLKIYDYEKAWKNVAKDSRRHLYSAVIPGCFIGYDDTPRRGNKGRVIKGQSVSVFEKYFETLFNLCCENDKEILLVTAWNEWGEGAYLEPDSEGSIAYLETIKKVKDKS